MKHRPLLALSVPLALAGCLAGHGAAYAFAGSSNDDTLAHRYLAYAPLFLAACVTVLGFAFALRIAGRLGGCPSAWPFAALPPATFVTQELLERRLSGLPAHRMLERPVFIGLAAQLPIAAVGYLAAKALVRVADHAARALASSHSLALRTQPLPAAVPVRQLRTSGLALDRLGRAPPGC